VDFCQNFGQARLVCPYRSLPCEKLTSTLRAGAIGAGAGAVRNAADAEIGFQVRRSFTMTVFPEGNSWNGCGDLRSSTTRVMGGLSESALHESLPALHVPPLFRAVFHRYSIGKIDNQTIWSGDGLGPRFDCLLATTSTSRVLPAPSTLMLRMVAQTNWCLLPSARQKA